MKKNKKIGYDTSTIILIATAVVGIILFILVAVSFTFKDNFFSVLFPKKPSNANAITAISKPTAVTVQFTKGTITSVNTSTLVIRTTAGSSTYSLSQTKDYQKIVSGSIEAFNAVTTSAAVADLHTGQQVMVVWNTSSIGSARAVYLIP